MAISYIRIPRSLLEHSAYIQAPPAYRCVLIGLIEGCAFLPCEFYDHGKIIYLQPGQIVITRRGFAEKINVHEMDVRRALDKFQRVQILTHKVTHTKTLVTITHSDTYALIKKYSDPSFDPRVTQVRPIKGEGENKRTREATTRASGGAVASSNLEKETPSCLQALDISDSQKKRITSKHDEQTIIQAVEYVNTHEIKTTILQTLNWALKEKPKSNTVTSTDIDENEKYAKAAEKYFKFPSLVTFSVLYNRVEFCCYPKDPIEILFKDLNFKEKLKKNIQKFQGEKK